MNEDRQILTKEFSLAEVLGVISGYLLVDKGFDRLQELMEWLVGGPVFTHQIPYIADDVKKALKKQFPQFDLEAQPFLSARIESLVREIKNKNGTAEWLIWGGLIAQYGAQFQVAPMQPFDELEMPPLITPNIEGKVLILEKSSDEFPDIIDADTTA